MIKDIFFSLVLKFDEDNPLAAKQWAEAEKHYSKSNRHYHTLHHLENLLVQLSDVRKEIRNWDAVLFALFYHDIVYNVLKKDNEEKSAVFAAKQMVNCKVPGNIIDDCCAMILATKTHVPSGNSDINIFTDADLSVLGQDWTTYETYLKQIREEYSIYPDFVYNPGRKKVLEHFLEMERIFKTKYFFDKFEAQAKENLKRELEQL